MCREIRDGACVGYAEKVRAETEESRAHGTSAEAREAGTRISTKTETRGQTGSGQCAAGTNGYAECDSSNTACARCEAEKRLEGSQCVDGIGAQVGRGLTAEPTPKACEGAVAQCLADGTNCLDIAISNEQKVVCIKCEASSVPIDGACQTATDQSAICTAGTDTNQGTCTACLGSYYLYSGGCYATCPDGMYADSSAHRCTACGGTCKTCSGAGIDKCMSCSTAENYLKLTDSSAGTGECVAKGACGTAHFEVEVDKKCYPCGDSAHGGIDGCTTCAFSQVSGQSTLTCSVCTPDTKKPNADGTKCVECTTAGCAKCSDEGVCVECGSSKYLTPTKQCVDDCGKLGGYYADGQRVCQPCDSSCAACVGVNANQCSACPAGKVLQYTTEGTPANGGSCVDECKTGAGGCADCGATIGGSKYCSRCSDTN